MDLELTVPLRLHLLM